MKRFIQTITVLSVTILLGAVAASAQFSTRAKANIPFDFNIGSRSFDAGTYGIRIMRTTAGSAAVTFLDDNGTAIETVVGMVQGQGSLGDRELLFDRTGDNRVLRNIVIGGSGIAIPVSRERRRLATTVSLNERLAVPITSIN
jgi:hypothetical protein